MREEQVRTAEVVLCSNTTVTMGWWLVCCVCVSTRGACFGSMIRHLFHMRKITTTPPVFLMITVQSMTQTTALLLTSTSLLNNGHFLTH